MNGSVMTDEEDAVAEKDGAVAEKDEVVAYLNTCRSKSLKEAQRAFDQLREVDQNELLVIQQLPREQGLRYLEDIF